MDPAPPAESPATSFRVLLVEDDTDLGETLQEGLKADHVSTVRALNGRDALETIRDGGINLILLDLGLPGMDGFEFLERLKRNPVWKNIPVIVLTAANATTDKVRAFDLGALDYVTKPFELVELRARVRAALRLQRLQQDVLEANKSLEDSRLAAVEAAEAKADFLAAMSHEIRTPMNGVIAMTGLLMQTDLVPDQRDFVETIRTSGESLLTIINDILNFSKIESGKMELEQRPVDLRECVEDALDLFASKASEKNLDLVCRVTDDVPAQVVSDPTRLRQILINLIGNAIKFTPSGEVFVSISSTSQPEQQANGTSRHDLHFAVRDTGIGIPVDRMDRLFRSFSQVDSSITRQYGGTGLGLAISKGLVELMSGKMWVESVEGFGSTFHFRLSLPVAVGTSTQTAPPPSALSGLRMLVVEDGASSRNVIAEHLKRWGIVPIEAENSAQAVAAISENRSIAMAIVDRQLPGQTGIPLVTDLRKNKSAASLPVILLNSMGATIDGSEPLPPNCIVLNKPVKPAQLQSALISLRSGASQSPVKKTAGTSKLDSTMAERLPLKILLTDDNVINQKVALRLLQQLGYKADTANNGLEAIKAVEEKPYDVILMDVQMPELDGLEATRRIRQRQQEGGSAGHFNRPIVIIAMTANAMQGDREKCVAAGMDDYLPKPVRPETLQSMLQQHGTRLSASGKSRAGTAAESSVSNVPSGQPELKVLSAPPAVSPVIEQPPVDMDRLNEFAGGNLENYNELVALYIKQTTEQLEQIHTALGETNCDRASRLAHSCAGASATCGMTAIVPLLRQVERLGQEGKAANAAELMPAIENEFQRLKRYLDTHKPIALAS